MAQLRRLSRKTDIRELLIHSVAPSVHGHEHVKEAILMATFGAPAVDRPGQSIRGDINVILLGDPGIRES